MGRVATFALVAFRFVFALFYFGVGLNGLITGNQAHDIATASTPFQRALSESGFMDPLLCVACITGGGALFFARTAPLGIVILAPLVTVIFLFHVLITHDLAWGALNLLWLAALAFIYRRGLEPLWNFKPLKS